MTRRTNVQLLLASALPAQSPRADSIGLCASSPFTLKGAGRPSVGAIRWDAWHGQRGTPGRAVEKSLGPAKWRSRLPFFATIGSGSEVSIDGATQTVMDKEIRYAAQSGLDYWAFVTYGPDEAMSLGLKLYLASERKREIRFCLITEHGRWGGPKRLLGAHSPVRLVDAGRNLSKSA